MHGDAKGIKQTFSFHFQPVAVGFHGKQTLGGVSVREVYWGSTRTQEGKKAGLGQGRSRTVRQAQKGFSQSTSSRPGMAP